MAFPLRHREQAGWLAGNDGQVKEISPRSIKHELGEVNMTGCEESAKNSDILAYFVSGNQEIGQL